MALESHTIVRKVRAGSDGGRFVILGEIVDAKLFVFRPLGPEMTMHAVCAALIAHGISEPDAVKLISEAVDDFDGAQGNKVCDVNCQAIERLGGAPHREQADTTPQPR